MASFDAMAIFAEVARSRSFTEAARSMDMPLSSVSRKVSELEVDLNTRLIDRSKRQIRLTRAGQSYFELCRQGIDTLTYANRVMTDRQSDTSGAVTITVPPNLVEVLFLEAIREFQLQYPKARLRVLVSERMLDFVEDGVDLSFRVAAPEHPDLVVRTLLKYRHRLLATPGYLAINSAPERPEDLENHRRIGFGFHTTENVSWSLSSQGKTEGFRFSPDLAINDYAAVKAAVLNGQGIGELPAPLCGDCLRTGELSEVLPDWRFPNVKLYAVHAGKTSLSKLARLFLDCVVAHTSNKYAA